MVARLSCSFLSIPALACIAFTTFGVLCSRADLPSAGSIVYPAANLAILDFNGTEVRVSDHVDGATVEATASLAHSSSTGQISGTGTGSIRRISASGSDFSGTGDVYGTFTFTARPIKRGSIITLSGAKLVTNLSGSGSVWTQYGTFPFSLTSKPTFNFKSLEVSTSAQPLSLRGVLNAGKLPVSATGKVNGTVVRRSVLIPYPTLVLDPTQMPSDSLMALSADVFSVVQSSKGVVQGSAYELLDNQNSSTAGYTVQGTRSAKTGFSKLTLTGIGSFKGTSAVLNVDDSYQIKTGKGFSNSLKAYGYSVTF